MDKLISVIFPLVLNLNGFKDFRVCFRERRIILFCISIICHIELTFRCLIGRQLFKAKVIRICSIFRLIERRLFFHELVCQNERHFLEFPPAYSMAFSLISSGLKHGIFPKFSPAYSMAFFFSLQYGIPFDFPAWSMALFLRLCMAFFLVIFAPLYGIFLHYSYA